MAELSELTQRSGLDGNPIEIDDDYIRSGTLRRSGSLRFGSSRVSERNNFISFFFSSQKTLCFESCFVPFLSPQLQFLFIHLWSNGAFPPRCPPSVKSHKFPTI